MRRNQPGRGQDRDEAGTVSATFLVEETARAKGRTWECAELVQG